MLNEQTITILNSLKLFGMARGISERLANPGHGELSHADFVCQVGATIPCEHVEQCNDTL